MKKLLFVLLAAGLIATTACKKDSSENAETYTINYSIKSIGATIDTIGYKDASGNIQYMLNQTNFEMTVTQPSNNCHAWLYASGGLSDFGWCDGELEILNESGNIVHYKEGKTDGPATSFRWSASYDNTAN